MQAETRGSVWEREVKNSCGTPESGGGIPGHLPDILLTLCPYEANTESLLALSLTQSPPFLTFGTCDGKVYVGSDREYGARW